MVIIFVYSRSVDHLSEFYTNKFTFKKDSKGYIPFGLDQARIRIIHSADHNAPTSEPSPIARFCLDQGLGEHCMKLMSKGVRFELIAETPGAFVARFLDGEGNSFELWCPVKEFDELEGLREHKAFNKF